MPPAADDARAYYRDAAVQTRIAEYCGASRHSGPTCAFVSQLAPRTAATWETAARFNPSMLPALFDDGWDLSRSLVDSDAMIVHFEIDYFNPDDPGDAVRRPLYAFSQMEPLYRAIRDELRRLELPLLDVMTGRGYHFTGRVPLGTSVVSRIAALSPSGKNRRERAHVGLGMLLEYLAHNVLAAARRHSTLPIVVNGVEVGRGGGGREAVSIDLSEYGDPVGVRQIRAAFSTYQSHRIRPDIFGDAAASLPPLAAVPRRERALEWMLEHARHLDQARALASGEHAAIHTVTTGTENLLAEYDVSSLREVHQAFYAAPAAGSEVWPTRFDPLEASTFLGCVGAPLHYPNDALLKPTVIQHVTRILLAQGWNARDIAGLIWSKYGRDYGWQDRWQRLDPQVRAEFDVRVFASLAATGLDRAIDLNCVSAQEKHLCPRTGCTHDLRVDRDRLLERVSV